jgi:tetratricopeptide (TPR) repeat protein
VTVTVESGVRMVARGHSANRVGPAPAPTGAATVEEFTRLLRILQEWSGMSYRAVHRQVVAARTARRVPERPVLNTVYRCFQPGRTRLDVELVADIAAVLLGDETAAYDWRRACQAVVARIGAAAIVDVSDRLPDDLASFTGRRVELKQIAGLADTGRGAAIAIQGMAGMGKTRLAVHAGHALLKRGRCTDVQLAVDLRGYDPDRPPADPAAVLEAFLRRLGARGDQIQHQDLAGRTAMYQRLLAGRSALILLDNAGSVEQVRPLLADRPGCLTLITSRHALDDLPGVAGLSLDVFRPDEATDVLRRVVGERRIAADPAAAAQIAQVLGHLPLALGLLAARMRLSPDWTLADHLDRIVQRRTDLRLDDGVELAVGLSYEALTPDLRRMFRLLALHPGGDLDAFAAAALVGTDLDTARYHLTRLLDESLLQQKASGRYGFHDLISVYAKYRAHDEEATRSRRSAMTRLLGHYEFTATVAMDHYSAYEKSARPQILDPGTPTPALTDAETATAWLDAERPNLIAAAAHAADHGWPGHTRRLSTILFRYLQTAGHISEAQTLHSRALLCADLVDAGHELRNLGRVYWHRGEYDKALDHCQRSLLVARAAGDRPGEQRAHGFLGPVLFSLGRYEEALFHSQRALAIARETGDRGREAGLLANLGNLWWVRGRYPEALEGYEQSLTMAREVGDRIGEGLALGNLGRVHARLGHPEQALHHFREALVLHREVGDRLGEHNALDRLGELHIRLGHLRVARDELRQSLAIARELGNPEGESRASANLGIACCLLHRKEEAAEYGQQAVRIASDIGDRTAECHALNSLGRVYVQLRRYDEAQGRFRQALDLADDLGDPYEQAKAHDGLADVLLADGEVQGARTHRVRALELFIELGVPDSQEIAAQLADRPGVAIGS